jgi:hypothetical protein
MKVGKVVLFQNNAKQSFVIKFDVEFISLEIAHFQTGVSSIYKGEAMFAHRFS